MLKANEEKTEMYAEIFDLGGNVIARDYACPYFQVKRIIQHLPSDGKREVELFYQLDDECGMIKFGTELLSKHNQMMSALASNLFIVGKPYQKEVASMIEKQAQQVIRNKVYGYEHNFLGWKEFNGKNYFFLDDVNLGNNIRSNCIRNCGKFTNGSEKKYDNLLKNYVFMSPQMSLAYCIGFASVVSGLISNFRGLDVPIVGLTGRSTTGKTTALKLIASIWGDPNSNGTVILKNQATEKGFQAQITGLFGYPICFDDLDTNQKLDMETFLYDLSRGTQRTFSDVDGNPVFTRHAFSGLAIITGENSLVERTSQKMGLFSRVLELDEVKWTCSDEFSTKIKDCVSLNYGFKGKKFAKFIQNKSLEKILEQFDHYKKLVKQNLNQTDKFADRTSSKLALINQTIALVNECFGLSLDERQLMSFAYKSEIEQQNKRNKSKLAYEFMYSYYQANKNKFDIKQKRGDYISQTRERREGIALLDELRVDLYVPVSTAKRILKANGFPQIGTYQAEWRDNGYTKCENGRFDKSNSELGRHYHFVYEFENTENGGV